MQLDSYRIKTSAEEQRNTKRNFKTVQEKIILEKREQEPVGLAEGPTLDLFFHELTNNESKAKLLFDKIAALVGLVVLILLYPVIALSIKLTSRGPVLIKQKSIGFRGNQFDRYFFRTRKHFTGYPRKVSPDENPFFLFGKFLTFTGLYVLPNVINILKGEMNLVGPRAFPESVSTYWNNRFSQFYKRYATRPGIISMSSSLKEQITDDYEYIKEMLGKEFSYLTYPSLKKDLRVIFRKIRT